MKLCCENFENLVANAGKKGFSAVPLHSSGMTFFLLQFRGGNFSGDDKITTIGDVGIKYCPFCGTRLAKIINSNMDFIIQLAERHKNLIH